MSAEQVPGVYLSPELEPPVVDWWSLIDQKAALREQFPPADVVRATERVSLGVIHTEPGPIEWGTRLAVSQTADADRFISLMEERTRARTLMLTRMQSARDERHRRRTASLIQGSPSGGPFALKETG